MQNIFSHSVASIFILPMVSFEAQILMKSNLQVFLKKGLCFWWCVLRTVCLTQGHKAFVLCFLQKLILVFIFRSVSYFELIFINFHVWSEVKDLS